MIACAACQHQELWGALFCSRCGTQLNYQSEVEIASTFFNVDPVPESPPTTDPAHPSIPQPSPLKDEPEVGLKFPETGEILSLEGSAEFTLGRVSGDQPILPDIDLSAYQALACGVSRLHATIKVMPDKITITDLGSANGTRVNGKKLVALEPQPLVNGDRILLGKLRLQMVIHKSIS
jgi:hypothetical protein